MHTGPAVGAPRERLTFVLPLSGARDIATARHNLLPSLDAMFPLDEIAELLVVGTAAEYRGLDFSDAVSPAFATRIRVLSETEVVGGQRSFVRARGWHKQQIVKLAISDRIRTRRYCTLDSDMYLVRPCSTADWIVGGKCIYNRTPLARHPKWWRRAARQLRFDLDLDPEDGFGVTPALLYTDIVRELVEHLETRGKGLIRAIRQGATEYTLYWLYLRKHHFGSDLYAPDLGSLYARCLWKPSELDCGDIRRLIDHQFMPAEHHYFSLIQSTSRLVDEPVLQYVRAKIRSRAA